MVNFGIIGCGKIGVRHIEFLKKMDGVRVKAVSDSVAERAREVGKTFGVEHYTNYRDVLHNPDIDVVNICTPSGMHASMSIDALNAGKHVICEKPMALSTADADAMIAAAKANNKHLFIVKQNRHNVPIRILRDALDKGMFGTVYAINANVLWNRRAEYYQETDWRGTKQLDGGALATLASHFLDIMQWVGGPVRSVFAKTDRFMHAIETEDTGAVILKFTSGATGTIFYTSCTYNKNLEGSITVLGTKGSAKISGEYLNKIEYWNVEGYPLPEQHTETAPANDYGSYRGSASKHDSVFREAIKKIIGDENSHHVDAVEGRKTVELIEAVHRSAMDGKEVFLGEKKSEL